MASSVVTNNYLKDFDAHVQFEKGIIQGGGEKLWEDLKALGFALTSPIETIKAIGTLLSNPENLKQLAVDEYNNLVDKFNNVYSALFSDIPYEGKEANNAGRDLGEFVASFIEAYGGTKLLSTSIKTTAKVDIYAQLPKKLDYTTSSGVNLVVNPNKTTTVLGSYTEDMASILKETNYPKTIDFDAKQGSFNILNVPDSSYKGLSSQEFWDKFNKPFLDKAIERGDDIILATKPKASLLDKNINGVFQETGFGKEYRYLNSKGYVYDEITNKMINPLK
ncbi:hypothetical protein [Aliarcobacter butzleri]|uniref:Uncharacterized protein n=1 Tax=Aliarcobacter butzleri L351 TaxID=1447259 RepID=A0A837J5C5_9BACT|nr:hypothetical protein [Aliarcobacter butzleri]KLE00572.1 hypothetical protein AF76_07595 [Aliarcobacter butzleri L351]KLE13457.1 hypothetical protein AF75_03490 [Aliarcobacter butzleri L350]